MNGSGCTGCGKASACRPATQIASYRTTGSANVDDMVITASSSAGLNAVRVANSVNHWIALSREIERAAEASWPNSSSSSWKRTTVCCSPLPRARSPGQSNTSSAARNRSDQSRGEAEPWPSATAALLICAEISRAVEANVDGAPPSAPTSSRRSKCIRSRSRSHKSSRARGSGPGVCQ